MSRFVTRPVEIEAHRYFGLGHPEKTPEGVCFCAAGKAFSEDGERPEPHVHSLEGTMHVSVGDYIITGTRGERYPCKPGPFMDKYEPKK